MTAPGRGAARSPGSIGFSVVRAGDIVGEHTVTLCRRRRAYRNHPPRQRTAMIFARGALRAAAWLCRPARRACMACRMCSDFEKKHGQ